MARAPAKVAIGRRVTIAKMTTRRCGPAAAYEIAASTEAASTPACTGHAGAVARGHLVIPFPRFARRSPIGERGVSLSGFGERSAGSR
ncbi:hypothetical protein Ate02nite_42260 [Paractinoplanes tereljensis]|uniref:Uncharacterized protein n=1 Tax=Paractinoplanes tereljensis TaxID=571912 RepID=A0A919NMF7_9ACTN|nr:hypothetical protein Ate02nite_42260 [Actinoplanes tereljensis]